METKKIISYHSHFELNDYELGDCEILERKLSVYDKIYYKWIPTGFIYDQEKKKLLIPSGVSASWVSRITGRELEVNYEPDKYANMSIRLTQMPRNDLQRECISFLTAKGEFKNYSIYSQLVLNLDTGEGKTYLAIALTTIKRLKTIIIINSNKIKSQWIDKYKEYTDIDEKSILEITGSSMCANIINRPYKYSQYKIFVTTHDTLHSFGNKYGWENVHELFKTLEIGIKIYDEAHLRFNNIINIDCYTNTKYTYYLTATFGRSSIYENFVYNLCFKSIPKYEQKNRGGYEGKKYITYMALFYESKPTLLDINNLKNKYGFDRNAYAKYQLVDDNKFFDILTFLIQFVVIKKQLKTLILLTTIEGIEDVKDFIKKEFPEITVGTYHSKMKDKEEKEKSIECDIILSTSKSLGVGADIPNLRAVINTESYKSAIITEQIVGRLRKPSGEDTKCLYVETVDKAFSTLRRQQKEREKLLKKIVGSILYYKKPI